MSIRPAVLHSTAAACAADRQTDDARLRELCMRGQRSHRPPLTTQHNTTGRQQGCLSVRLSVCLHLAGKVANGFS